MCAILFPIQNKRDFFPSLADLWMRHWMFLLRIIKARRVCGCWSKVNNCNLWLSLEENNRVTRVSFYSLQFRLQAGLHQITRSGLEELIATFLLLRLFVLSLDRLVQSLEFTKAIFQSRIFPLSPIYAVVMYGRMEFLNFTSLGCTITNDFALLWWLFFIVVWQ